MTKFLALIFLAIGCGGSPAPSSATTTSSSGAVAAAPAGSEDCMGGGTLALDSSDCHFWGEVMGPPEEGGTGIHMLNCCYPTQEAACRNTGGCELADCTADAATPAQVTCKDTTHGGVPTNP